MGDNLNLAPEQSKYKRVTIATLLDEVKRAEPGAQEGGAKGFTMRDYDAIKEAFSASRRVPNVDTIFKVIGAGMSESDYMRAISGHLLRSDDVIMFLKLRFAKLKPRRHASNRSTYSYVYGMSASIKLYSEKKGILYAAENDVLPTSPQNDTQYSVGTFGIDKDPDLKYRMEVGMGRAVLRFIGRVYSTSVEAGLGITYAGTESVNVPEVFLELHKLGLLLEGPHEKNTFLFKYIPKRLLLPDALSRSKSQIAKNSPPDSPGS